MAMKKKEIIIENDNPTQLEIILENHQSDGVYIYRPETEDDISLIIYDDDNNQWEFPADNSDPTYVFANIDTSDIPAGEYRYRVVITMAADDSTYILNMADHIIVRR